MKKYLFIIITILFFAGCKQTGKKEYDVKQTDKREYYVKPVKFVCNYPFNETSKWAVTCRVWGLLKYYHPNVTTGNLDWDKVLLDRLDNINEASTYEQVNTELMGMISDAGPYFRMPDNTWNDSLNMNVNLCWLDHSFISQPIKQELRKIASLKVYLPSRYVGNQDPRNYENALGFDNEKDYPDFIVTQSYKLRMLALFRYWNVVYYFFAFKHLMDQSWDVVLDEFIPQFMNASDNKEYHEVINKISTKLNDGHAFTSVTPRLDWKSPEDHFFYNIIAMIDTNRVVRTPPEGSFLKSGDIVKSINGQDVNDFTDSIATIFPSSNSHYLNAVVNVLIGNTIMDGCLLTVSRGGKELNVRELPKKQATLTESPPFHMISSETGYFNVGLIKTTAEVIDIMKKIEHIPAVIFDLRNYPHPTCLFIMCFLTSDPQLYLGREYIHDLAHCGSFYINEGFADCPPDSIIDCSKKYRGKIVVLTYALTMSFPEALAMHFRNYGGATLIGTPTAGAHGNVSWFSMPGGIMAHLATVGKLDANGEIRGQGKGVIPDIEVYPTMESIMEGKDEILEEAIKYINSLR